MVATRLVALLTALNIGFAIGCKDVEEFRLYIADGTITSRTGDVMRVRDTSLPPGPCDSTIFGLSPTIIVLNTDGTAADTSALQVGKRVAVWVPAPGAFLSSCPDQGVAGKVQLH